VATTASQLLSDSNCFACFGVDLTTGLILSRLSEIYTALTGMAITPQELSDRANCYVCIGVSLGVAMELVLLGLISDSLGGGGGAGVFSSLTVGSPTVIASNVNLSDASGVLTATLTNSPVAGNATKWVTLVDNGISRRWPVW